MNGIGITPEGPIQAGGFGIEHEGRSAAQAADQPNRQQAKAQQQALGNGKVTSRGAQIEREVVTRSEQQKGSTWFKKIYNRVEQLFRADNVLEAMGAENNVEAALRQHAFLQRADHHSIGHLL